MVRAVLSRHIDLMHLGRDRVICAYEWDGIVVDPGPASCVEHLLAGGFEPRVLLLTHIHLDHAGAAGVLVRRFPKLEVYVHERGARHLADPSKLLASASQLYGDQMERLWGEVAPVPEANLRPLSGGEVVEGCRVDYTPGHASHHVTYFHEETGQAYVGDMCGVRLHGQELTFAPTPPPDIDVERWHASLDTIAGLGASSVCLTHFGSFDDVNAQIARVRERLDRWAALARETTLEQFVDSVEREIAAAMDEETAKRYVQAAAPDQLWLGLDRYWKKRAEREAA